MTEGQPWGSGTSCSIPVTWVGDTTSRSEIPASVIAVMHTQGGDPWRSAVALPWYRHCAADRNTAAVDDPICLPCRETRMSRLDGSVPLRSALDCIYLCAAARC